MPEATKRVSNQVFEQREFLEVWVRLEIRARHLWQNLRGDSCICPNAENAVVRARRGFNVGADLAPPGPPNCWHASWAEASIGSLVSALEWRF